ncbi:hypothetical protein ABIB66_008477 [Bradyrhizobium sp. F1.13.3]
MIHGCLNAWAACPHVKHYHHEEHMGSRGGQSQR